MYKRQLHLILNPDIKFDGHDFSKIVEVFKRESDLIVAMHKIAYSDGSLQRLYKLLPTPIDLIIRRFLPLEFLKALINKNYDLFNLPPMRLGKYP